MKELRNLTRRELEALKDDIDRALVTCVVCGEPGALAFRARSGNHDGTLDVCLGCFGRLRRSPSASA